MKAQGVDGGPDAAILRALGARKLECSQSSASCSLRQVQWSILTWDTGLKRGSLDPFLNINYAEEGPAFWKQRLKVCPYWVPHCIEFAWPFGTETLH